MYTMIMLTVICRESINETNCPPSPLKKLSLYIYKQKAIKLVAKVLLFRVW